MNEDTHSESRRNFEAIFSYAAMGIALVGPDGRPHLCNPALVRLLGYNEDELKAMHFADFTHPEDVDKDVELYGRLIAGEIPYYSIEKRYITKTGDVVAANLNVSLIRDSTGQPTHAVGMVEDITERRTANRERDRADAALETGKNTFRAIIDHSQDGILLLGRTGTILQSNRSGHEILSRYESIELGRESNLLDLLSAQNSELAASFAEKLTGVRLGEVETIQAEYNLPEESAYFEISLYAIDDDGDQDRVAVFMRDVSARRRDSLRMESQNTLLEKRVSIRTAELENSNRNLKQLEYHGRILHEVTSAANSAHSVPEALAATLDVVAGHYGWPVGHVFLPVLDSDRFRSSDLWFLADPVRYRPLKERVIEKTFGPGEELPGMVIKERRPIFALRTEHDYFGKMLASIGKAGSAFAFPVIRENRIDAIFLFCSEDHRSQDEDLTGLAEEIGIQLGYVLERKDAEHRALVGADLLRETQRLAGLGTWEIYPDTGRVTWSRQSFRIFGREFEDGEPDLDEFIQRVHPEDQAAVQAFLASLTEKGKPSDVVFRFRSFESDRENWISSHGRPVQKDGHLIKLLGTNQNISRIKKIEDDLREAKSIAEAASQAKSEFLANMSHEIRTPLNAIMGMTHLALRTDLDERQLDYLSKIDTASSGLLSIVNDILDFSKIEAGKMTLERLEFSFQEVLTNVGSVLAVRAEERGLEIGFLSDQNVPERAVGDALRLSQVLINLIGNAIKFTESGSVTVTTELIAEEDTAISLRFSVEDTGIGMTPRQVAGLFEAFSQADGSTTRRFGGTGLGLSICKRLVEMMQGEIHVESEINVGSRFSFTARFGKARRSSRRPMPADLKELHVLLVDDNAHAIEILSEMLHSFSFRVSTASSGAAAVEMVCAPDADFDVILLDWKMPELNGIESATKMYEHRGDELPPVILITAFSNAQIRYKAESHPALNGYLMKPVQQSVLLETIIHCFDTENPRDFATDTSPGEEAQYLAGARLLLVEDNAINLQVASEILESFGAQVIPARDGSEACRLFSGEKFDAVLMDVHMPVMDGYTATTRLRKMPGGGLPILAMTATVLKEDVRRALEAGMDAHISKPIDPKTLLQTLRKFLSISSGSATNNMSTTGSGSDLPPVSGIDVSSALNRINGNRSKLLELYGQFCSEYSDFRDRFEAILRADDNEQVCALLHSLRGVSANLGMEDLASRSGTLERQLQEPSLLSARRDMESFLREFDRAYAGAQSLAATAPEENSAVESPPGEYSLERLKMLTARSETAALRELRGLKGIFAARGLDENYEVISGCLNRYDFRAAAELLSGLPDIEELRT